MSPRAASHPIRSIAPSKPIEEPPERRGFDFGVLERHIQEVGALHTDIYRMFRNLAPAMVLTGYWFYKHPGVIAHGQSWWNVPQVNLFDISIVLGITILSRIVTGRAQDFHDELIRKEVSSSIFSTFICACALYPCLMSKLHWSDAIRVDAGFILGTLLLSLALLAVACFIGWVSIDTIIPKREVLIIGSGRAGQAVFEELVDSPVYHVVGILDDAFVGTRPMSEHHLGGLALLDALLKENPISVVFCSLPVKSMYEPIQQVIEVCEQFGVEIRHSTQLFQTSIAKLAPPSGSGYSVLRMVREDSTRYVKRIFDIVGSASLLVLTAPLLLAASVAIKLTSRGPVLFSQDRYGLYRRRFRILKLRTMVVNAEILQAQLESLNELGGPVFKIRQDPRVTRLGAFLRKTSIDELPQLWNVLRGDMSLVGPRPLAVRDVLKIEDSAQLRRFSVVPGITCIWQVSGRNNTDFEGWIRQDLQYIDNWSLMLDFKILASTVPAVLWGKGAM